MVDPILKVIDIDGLRVIDSSIIPIITSADVNAATMMIGERGSDLVKDDWNYPKQVN